MSESQPTAHGPRMTRRGLIKTVGAVGTAAAAPVALDGTGADPVGDADALACGGICVGAAVVGGAAAIGWALREYEVIGSDAPPEGLTPDGLKTQLFSAAETRKSVNKSTFIDNQNIISGIKHTAYAEGKIAAIEALNAQKTKSEVVSAGQAAVDKQDATVTSNLLKSWNESVSELHSFVDAILAHSDLTLSNLVGIDRESQGSNDIGISIDGRTATLADGSSFTLHMLGKDSDGTPGGTANGDQWDPIKKHENTGNDCNVDLKFNGGLQYLYFSEWNSIYSAIDSAFQDVRDGISLWADEVYSKVQSGELDTSDLLTPRELAQLTSSDESSYNQAIADLMALNIPVNLDREAKINLTNSGTTLYGSLGVTGETSLSSGTTVDPSTASNDYYLTYDVSEAHGNWTAFEENVDGGIVTFTSEPHPGATYALETGAQETATVQSSDLSDNGDGTWSVDISSQVETAITTLTDVQFYSESDETQMETVKLDEPFEIVEFTDSEGNTVDSADYNKPTQAETDSNYLTKEEWEQREQEYKEQIEKYEQQANSGGAGGISIGDFGPEGMLGGAVALVLVVVGIGQATN